MAGWLVNRTPYVSLAGAGIVLAAALGANTIFAGPGQSPPGPANVPAVAASASPPAAPPRAADAEAAAPYEFPEQAVYAGRADRIAVAVAVAGDRAAAYLCDGRRIEAWLSGRIEDGELRLRGPDGARLEGRLSGDDLVGTFEVRDRTYEFRIERAERPAGLYRTESEDGDTVIGWILLADGSQVGLRSDQNGVRPAPELTPGQPVRVADDTLDAQEVSGDDTV